MQEETLDLLVEAATKACTNAYVPYSSFPVGAAILTESGNIYSGTNIENASYGATVCAERVAVFKAVSEGDTALTALAIYTPTSRINFPCGMCLQVLAEFCEDMPIILASDSVVRVYQLSELLPHTFTSDNLN